MSILLARDLARISWGFQDPLDLFSLGAPASLIAEAALWLLVWSCPHPRRHPLPEFTQSPDCLGKVLDWICVHISEILLNSA